MIYLLIYAIISVALALIIGICSIISTKKTNKKTGARFTEQDSRDLMSLVFATFLVWPAMLVMFLQTIFSNYLIKFMNDELKTKQEKINSEEQ